MPAAKHDITIEPGTTFELHIVWTDSEGDPVDLTGYRVRCQVRESADSSSTLLSIDSATPVSGITVGSLDTDGGIDITVAPAVTGALNFDGIAVYDLMVTSPAGVVTRLIHGNVSLVETVTR